MCVTAAFSQLEDERRLAGQGRGCRIPTLCRRSGPESSLSLSFICLVQGCPRQGDAGCRHPQEASHPAGDVALASHPSIPHSKSLRGSCVLGSTAEGGRPGLWKCQGRRWGTLLRAGGPGRGAQQGCESRRLHAVACGGHRSHDLWRHAWLFPRPLTASRCLVVCGVPGDFLPSAPGVGVFLPRSFW